MTVDTSKPNRIGRDPDEERAERLPDHETDEETSVGAGVMGLGGTAVDRGTGTTSGQAQGAFKAPESLAEGPVIKDHEDDLEGPAGPDSLPGFQPRL